MKGFASRETAASTRETGPIHPPIRALHPELSFFRNMPPLLGRFFRDMPPAETQYPRFNPRLRVGGDAPSLGSRPCRSQFQSAPPRGRRRLPRGPTMRPASFQSAPPRGRRRQRLRPLTRISCFNPRLRVGGDRAAADTPGRGVVSIRASAWEATRASAGLRRSSSCFNPRLRVGGDELAVRLSQPPPEFQSAPPRGRRRAIVACPWGACWFQSAPPRGRRHGAAGNRTRPVGFNPRLRVGGDTANVRASIASSTFQSAPPRGRRRLPASRSARWSAFQSAPPRGRRHTGAGC